MEDVKTHPIETSALADQSSERANILSAAPDQQSSFQGSAIRPWSS